MGVKGTASAAFSLLLSLFLFNTLFPHLIQADGTVGIVCYGFNGLSYVNNTKCPGSNACCGYQATCVSNRLCHNPGDAEGTYVRGPCANNVWDSTCAQVCMFNETEQLSGFLPRVSQCSDGSWCCVNDATCCSNSRGVFLDSDGNSASAEGTRTVSYPPVSGTGIERYTESISTTEASTSSTTSISTTLASVTSQATSMTSSSSTTTATSAASDSTQDEDDNDDSGTKVGLGVGLGVPLAAIVAGLSVWFILRRKRRPDGAQLAASDDGLRNGMQSRGSVDMTQNGSPFARSDDGHTYGAYGSDATSAMLVASTPKNELSGEGKSIHELQSLAASPEYQRSRHPNSGSTDSHPPTHESYELA